MMRPIGHGAGRRQARPGRDRAAVAVVAALLVLSGCGSSKSVPPPDPSAVLGNATLADVACGDAGWTTLQDYNQTILLQAALYQGHLRQGEPGGPPAGAVWLVNGLIDPVKAAASPDFRTWTADAAVRAYLKPLQDWEASVRRDSICASSSSPRPTVSFTDFVCRAGGDFPETLGQVAVENYELALVGQSALSTGWMKQGSAGGPPDGVDWLSSGQLTPESISINSEYAQWETHAGAPSAAYFSALFEYNQVVAHHVCGAASAEYAKEFASLPTSITSAPAS